MERKWYKWVNGMWVEAPATITSNDFTLYNYNSEANEVMLREDGYLPENEIDLTAEVKVPEKITARQLKSAIILAGINLTAVDAIIATLPQPQRDLAMVDWEYSTNFYRNNSMINQIAGALKLTHEQVDNIFINGEKLVNDN